ncbi:MAG: tetratricopeptide repeat protein, partial [Bacteroidetes bacterium]|nr:tetratricopeptide repeat protein [Bacteroidota bacterium]
EDQPLYNVDHALLMTSKDKQKGNKEISKIISTLPPVELIVQKTADAFIKRDMLNEAIETYKKGRSIFNNDNLWHVELGKTYNMAGMRNEMINEYLEAVQVDAASLEAVENNLQQSMADSAQSAELKQALYTRLQKNPTNEPLMEMLIWYEIQQKDFKGAFNQLKVLDKRQKLEGRRIIEIARIAENNRDFESAINYCQYIIDQGKLGRYYNEAKNLQLETRRRKVTNGIYTQNDLKQLEKDYKEYISEYGVSPATASSIKDLAEMYAYYLNMPDTAITYLEMLTNMPRLSNAMRAECKLMLGDVYILIGNYWDPVLLYGQVDKDFKEDELGQEAKFRNAKLSYYKGEFEWSQTQLDILKKATSQLISNNSIELALLIQDNLGLDSNEEAMKLFADADLYIYQNKFNEAIANLDTIYARFPQHSLADDILYAKARIYRKQQQWQKALDMLDKVYTIYSYDILADNALFDAAEIYEYNLNNKAKAKELYEKLITQLPGSSFAVEARKRYRMLRGDVVN